MDQIIFSKGEAFYSITLEGSTEDVIAIDLFISHAKRGDTILQRQVARSLPDVSFMDLNKISIDFYCANNELALSSATIIANHMKMNLVK